MKNEKKSVSKVLRTTKMLMGMMLFSICLFLFSFESQASEGKVTAPSAKIRKEANTNSEALASVKSGDEVSIKSKTTGADGQVWYQVFVNADSLGFIRSDLLDFDGSVPELEVASSTTTNNNDTQTQNEPAEVSATTTAVETMPKQNATVTGGDVNVRADASTSAKKVTTAKNGTAVIVTGQANGVDGKVWYQINYTAEDKEINGFIRSDYLQLGDVIEEEVPQETAPPEEETPEEQPVQTPQTKDYDTVLETKEDGSQVWYLYMYSENQKYPIPQLISAVTANSEVDAAMEKQMKLFKIIIIVLIVVIVVLGLGLTLMFFKMHENGGFDDDDEDDEESVPVRKRAEVPSGQQVRRPVQGAERIQGRRPIQESVPRARQASGQRQTAPRAAGRPVRSADAEAVRRQGSGQPQRGTAGARPAGERPAQKPAGERPVQKKRPAAPKMPEHEVTYEEEPLADVKKNQNGQWHSKNFLADDDEFEFEFLNMDDPNKL